MLTELVQFCGGTPDMDIIDPVCEEWPKVGSITEKDELPDHMIKPLEFAYEWYLHYTENPGMRFRDSQNMLGEGD